MPKHTVKAINGRFKSGFFPGLKWSDEKYNWYKTTDRNARRPFCATEDKNRQTALGCGCWRTIQKEIHAAAAVHPDKYEEKRFAVNYGGINFRVYLIFQRWDWIPGFYWSFSHSHNGRVILQKTDIRATDRKKFSDIGEADALIFLKSVLMPPGYWLNYQIEHDLTKAETIKARRAKPTPRKCPEISVLRSIQKARAKVARQMERYYPDLSALYWSDEDPEQFIFSL